jgi:hypothetical protein
VAARNRTWTPEIVRRRIRTSMLLRRLSQHALGEIELSKTQVTAIQILLRKTLPDLTAVEHSGYVDRRSASDMSDAELADIASGGSARAAEPPESPAGPSGVH